jgi:hypothetical protein
VQPFSEKKKEEEEEEKEGGEEEEEKEEEEERLLIYERERGWVGASGMQPEEMELHHEKKC